MWEGVRASGLRYRRYVRFHSSSAALPQRFALKRRRAPGFYRFWFYFSEDAEAFIPISLNPFDRCFELRWR